MGPASHIVSRTYAVCKISRPGSTWTRSGVSTAGCCMLCRRASDSFSWHLVAAQTIENLDTLLGSLGSLCFPDLHERAVGQAFQKSIVGKHLLGQGRPLRNRFGSLAVSPSRAITVSSFAVVTLASVRSESESLRRETSAFKARTKSMHGIESVLRILRQGAGDDGAIVRRQRRQNRVFLRVLQQELPHVLARERQRARQQFLIGDAETVLIAMLAQFAEENSGDA